MIRVLVASDVRLYREGLAESLADAPGLDVVGRSTGAESVGRALRLRPDIVLLDLSMDDWSGAVGAIVAGASETRVVVLGVNEVESEVIGCAEAGVSGYVTREASLDELVEVVESVARGEMLCTPRIAALLLRRVAEAAAPRSSGLERLTPRETEIVDLIEQGLSNKQIARRLSIELATVKNHVHNILEKLEVARRGEAVARVRALAE